MINKIIFNLLFKLVKKLVKERKLRVCMIMNKSALTHIFDSDDMFVVNVNNEIIDLEIKHTSGTVVIK